MGPRGGNKDLFTLGKGEEVFVEHDISSQDVSRYVRKASLAWQAATLKMQFQLDIEEIGREGTRSRRHLERTSLSDVIDSQADSNR